MKGNKSVLQFANIAGFIGIIVVNGLANSLPINGKTTGQISDSYPNLFVPAGLTFSIWGLIYLLLGIFIAYQATDLFRKQKQDPAYLEKTGWFFLLSCAANIGWIFAWHYERLELSLVLMLILLGSLLSIYVRLNIGKAQATKTERYLVFLPFSVYIGWITIATVANITALLVSVGWKGLGLPETFWTVLVLIVATLITLAMVFTRRDVPYSLVVAWAFLGIIIKRTSSEPLSVPVIVTAAAGIAVILAGIAVRYFSKRARVHEAF